MGNKQICEKGVGWVEDLMGNVPCEAGESAFEATCQTIAIANMEDGVGEILESICDVSAGAFGYACNVGSPASTWKPIVKKELCKNL